MSAFDTSFDGEHADLGVMAVEAEEEEYTRASGVGEFLVKKLSDVFDNCAKSLSEGGMKVYLRVRPSSSKALLGSTVTIDSETTIVTNAPETSKRAQYTKTEERHYAFTRVFGPEAQQLDVYNRVASPLLERFLQGESCVLFAYGMTNAGKTYTIQGCASSPGIMPLLVNDILKRMADKSNWDLQVSMLEIYQEKVFDLLGKKRDKLSIRDGNGRVEVVKLSSHPITSPEDAVSLLDAAAVMRSKADTSLNSGSSRSHALYTLTLNQLVNGVEHSSIFQVVDLAGAERGSRTKAGASQQKEANIINMSLMQLWRCLQAMKRRGSDSTSQANMDIIPFRESKLTHLLMPLLGRVGLPGMAMLTCVNPQNDDYDETLSVLSNASLACKIKEITDIGRTTIGVNAAASANAASAVAMGGAGAGHARKASSSLTHRSSSLLGGNQAAKLATQQQSHATASTMKRNSSKGSNMGAEEFLAVEGEAPAASAAADERVLKELQKLRDEVASLKAENQSLLVVNLGKETEIRVEVANEMAQRSMHLLEQIQDLQEQLDAKTDHFHDVTKSCKKARRKQMEVENAETAKDLKEAEEELERVKMQYEGELDALRSEKHELEVELEEWKEKAEVALAKVAQLTLQMAQQPAPERVVTVFQTSAAVAPAAASRSAANNNTLVVPAAAAVLPHTDDAIVSEGARKSAAAEQFSQRLSRDQRFKKSAEAVAAERSPLKNISENSPNTKPENDKKRALSPKAVRSTSPVRKVQAVEGALKQPVMKHSAAKENHAAPLAGGKRPLRSNNRAL